MAGRPTKLTPELGENICKAIRAGAHAEHAAIAAGVPDATLYQWLRKGQNGEEPYADFAASFARARADAEERLMRRIELASSQDWRAAHTLLKILNPRRYSDRVEVKQEPNSKPFWQKKDE